MVAKRVFAGLDLGGTNVKLGLVSETGEVLERLVLPTEVEEGYERVIDRISDAIRLLARGSDVVALGAGVPGPLDPARGAIVEAPNLPDFADRPLAADLAARIGLPVYLENDANAAAVGEWWVGAGARTPDMIVLTVGTGIGGGLILDGRLYRGAENSAGEVGHMTIEPNGPECRCGNQGCLEALASATAIAARARAKINKGFESAMTELVGGDLSQLSAETVSRACASGDPVAQKVMEETGRYLGIGAANLVNLLNPALILVGGGAARAGSHLLDPMRKEMDRRAFSRAAAAADLKVCSLENDAGFIGAARVALDRCMEA